MPQLLSTLKFIRAVGFALEGGCSGGADTELVRFRSAVPRRDLGFILEPDFNRPWAHKPRRLRDLCRESVRSPTVSGRRRHYGQALEPQGSRVRKMIEAPGAELRYLSP